MCSQRRGGCRAGLSGASSPGLAPVPEQQCWCLLCCCIQPQSPMAWVQSGCWDAEELLLLHRAWQSGRLGWFAAAGMRDGLSCVCAHSRRVSSGRESSLCIRESSLCVRAFLPCLGCCAGSSPSMAVQEQGC